MRIGMYVSKQHILLIECICVCVCAYVYTYTAHDAYVIQFINKLL